jgi:CheY-like chemotaxis protein
VVQDGEEAVANLGRATASPALVLLDLKLPCRSGLEVLDWLRGQPRLKRCPVVVLTSSKEAPDVQAAYDLGANSYLIKPVEFQAFLDMVGTLNLYWLVLNQPAGDKGGL